MTKQKAFFIIFKKLSIKQITNFFWKVRVQLKVFLISMVAISMMPAKLATLGLGKTKSF